MIELVRLKEGSYKKVYSEKEKRDIENTIKNGPTGNTSVDLRNMFVYCEAFDYDFARFMTTKELVSINNNLYD
jgi:hypothetical protein